MHIEKKTNYSLMNYLKNDPKSKITTLVKK